MPFLKMIPIKGYTSIHPNIDWIEISSNESPEAIRLLQEFPENRCWPRLSGNSLAVDWLKEDPERINYTILCGNHCPGSNRLMQTHKYNIDRLPMLSSNPFAFVWLQELGQLKWPYVCRNPSIHAKHYIEQRDSNLPYSWASEMRYLELNPSSWAPILWEKYYKTGAYQEKPTWQNMSANPYFTELILNKYPDKISWKHFSINPNPLAVHYLLNHPEKIDLYFAEANPHPSMVQYVLKQVEERGARVDFSRNTCPLALHYLAPVIYDYVALHNSRESLHAELLEMVLSPDYLFHLTKKYNVEFKDILGTRGTKG